MSAVAYCPELNMYPEEVIVFPFGYEDGVMLTSEGACTNRYADGTNGVWGDKYLVDVAEEAGNDGDNIFCLGEDGNNNILYSCIWQHK